MWSLVCNYIDLDYVEEKDVTTKRTFRKFIIKIIYKLWRCNSAV
jgi:hypothetical protein